MDFRKFLKYFLTIAGIFAIILLGILCGSIYSMISNSKDLNVSDLDMDFTSFVYYTDPETKEVRELDYLYDEENRIWADKEQIPQYLKDAVVAIEDERFFKHNGFDVKRIIGAAFSFIKDQDSAYGASTITQQLVKNLTGDDEVTLQRKIVEIYRAVKIEQTISKDRVLELYLNTIYLSQHCNGVQTASHLYFGKDVSSLTLAQCASLAGITQYPSKYDPIVHPENNKEKQELVLKKMLELGYISQKDYQDAVSEKLVFKSGKDEDESVLPASSSYFVDTVIEDVLRDLQEKKGYSKQIALKMLYSGGLQIYSTVDMDVQKAMEEVYDNPSNFPSFKGDTQPESAMVTIDPYTGHVVGIIGGRGEKNASLTFNRATQSLRQPGSTIKPIAVYAPAIEYGHIYPSSIVLDAPITINGWTPRNSGGSFSGSVTVSTAVARSLNIPAVKVLDKVSLDTSYDFLTRNLGITSLVENENRNGDSYTDKAYAALALGGLTDGISPLELCASYVPFINKGIYIKPSSYTKVVDHSGKILLEADKKDSHIAMSEQTAYLMTSMLQGVINWGTGSAAKLNNMPAAGKTGTTTNDFDRWFVGYTPYYVSAVWFGYDTPRELSGIGGNPAIPVWRNVMQKIHSDKEYKKFSIPSGLVKVSVCTACGKRATSKCAMDIRGSTIATGYFKEGSAPTAYCSIHKTYTICTCSGLLASDTCPEEYRKTVSALGTTDASDNDPEKTGYLSNKVCALEEHIPPEKLDEETVPEEP